jgi:hypothetical protein
MPWQSGYVSESPIYEKSLVDAWIKVRKGTIFNDINRQPIMIINPGIVNKNEGPDIHDAIIFTEGKLISGKIEVHIRARDWFYHGHESDPKYNNIILHITAFPDKADRKLNNRLIYFNPKGKDLQCDLKMPNAGPSLEKSLIEFGLKRWSQKVHRYQSRNWKNRVLQDSFKLFGKGGNENNFLHLLELFQRGKTPDSPELINIQWHHRGIRPNAWPENRISNVYNLFQYINILITPPAEVLLKLKSMVNLNLYVELTGNIFNPLAASTCLNQRDFNSYKKLKEEWLNLKLGYSYGRFQKQFSGVLSTSQLKTFSILQGLIVLEESFCNDKHCIICPVKRSYGNLG